MNGNGGSSYWDTPGSLTNVTVRNGVVENLFENGTLAKKVNGIYTTFPLFLYSDGPSVFQLSNITFSNAIFNCRSFLNY